MRVSNYILARQNMVLDTWGVTMSVTGDKRFPLSPYRLWIID